MVPRTNPMFMLRWRRSLLDLNKLTDEKLQNVHHFYTKVVLGKQLLFFCLPVCSRESPAVDEALYVLFDAVGW